MKKESIISRMRTALKGKVFTGQEASDLYISFGGAPRSDGKKNQIKDMYDLCCSLPADMVENKSARGSQYSLRNTYRIREQPPDPKDLAAKVWERFSEE